MSSSASSSRAPRRDTSRCSHCLATVPPPPAVRDGGGGGAAHALVAPPAAPQPAAAIVIDAPRRFLKCRRCYSTAYCDAACQRAHWPAHKRGCADPTLTLSTRSAALFLGTANEGPAILELLAYNGYAEDVAQCLDLCKDARSNPILWALVDVPRGPKRRTRLVFAVLAGRLERVQTLLSYLRVDVNRGDIRGATALHWASWNGSLDVVRELLGRGAIVDARTEEGSTPLSQAAYFGYMPLLRELVARGADVNARTKTGVTPLMQASLIGDAAAVTALLECGADANVQEAAHGVSALMYAAMKGHLAAVRALLAAPGIALDLRFTADGAPALTALGWVRQKGYSVISAALAAAGAH